MIDKKEAPVGTSNRIVLRLLIGRKKLLEVQKVNHLLMVLTVMKEAPGNSLKNSFDTIDSSEGSSFTNLKDLLTSVTVTDNCNQVRKFRD